MEMAAVVAVKLPGPVHAMVEPGGAFTDKLKLFPAQSCVLPVMAGVNPHGKQL